MGKLIQGSGESSPTAKALVQKIDSYCRTIEDVVANIDAELNDKNQSVCEPQGVSRSHKSHVTGEVLEQTLLSYTQTIEEVR